ncbi:hypothetical protein FB451DRAFT_1416158 [Mycena latifolia]|nr:hypothetical protein FB451DRAFT_1416158 [Mycena latifolia]
MSASLRKRTEARGLEIHGLNALGEKSIPLRIRPLRIRLLFVQIVRAAPHTAGRWNCALGLGIGAWISVDEVHATHSKV